MERQHRAGRSWVAFAAVVGSFLVGAFFLVAAVLVVAGVVTVAGWGEGTLVQRVVVGLVAASVGGVTLAAAGMQVREGTAGTRAAGDSRPARTGPFPAGTRAAGDSRPARTGPFPAGGGDEDGYGHAGFGVEPSVRRREGSSAHPGVGEF
ncbi:hypothetical protein [Pseudosporangium ferrugineum]|uniref:Uncharacterized protein n=1 Tax=Pseudosporangium ferrugineum TaxID=439699 RepID=A0A2T0SFR8_9ACTN|nr:hypothetical protein [Pseudosporangium ferrugineum]PRY32247.1 hypothetical protein CLV70_102458 [Pseudosporangium ferrugineum]